jgi:hypothetical protein
VVSRSRLASGLNDLLPDGVPMSSITAVKKTIGRWLLTRYGGKQGVVAIGRVAPFGRGTAIRAAGNHAFGRLVVDTSRRVFGPAHEFRSRGQPCAAVRLIDPNVAVTFRSCSEAIGNDPLLAVGRMGDHRGQAGGTGIHHGPVAQDGCRPTHPGPTPSARRRRPTLPLQVADYWILSPDCTLGGCAGPNSVHQRHHPIG